MFLTDFAADEFGIEDKNEYYNLLEHDWELATVLSQETYDNYVILFHDGFEAQVSGYHLKSSK